MVTRQTWLRRAFSAFLICAATAVHARAGELSAQLSKDTVPAGEGATLTLKIEGGTVEKPQFPKVPDMVFQGPATNMSRTTIINGVVSQSLTLSYLVGSNKPGDYTIPPITVKMDGREYKTQSFTLKVTPSANQAPQGLEDRGEGIGESTETRLVVELALKDGRKHVWVGEIAPVRIQAWIPDGVPTRLTSNLQPESSAFTLHNLSSEPQKSQDIANGRRWLIVTWFAGLSAAKAGMWLPDLTLKALQTVPDPNALRGTGGWGRQGIQKEVLLSSKKGDGKPIEVRALPREGRPKNFSGAVGKFTLQGANLPAEWKTGEPLPVSAVITGEGNFNLLAQPDLRPGDNWKSYDGKPQFQAGDRASFKGTQTWKFSAVARKSGQQPLSLGFSYFDPETGSYQTAESAVQKVQVSGADLPPETDTAAAGMPSPDKKDPASALAALHTRDTGVRSLTPLAFRSAFRTILAGCGAAALAGVIIGMVRTRRRDSTRALREAADKAARAALSEAESLAAQGDVPGFFAAARRALQTRLSALWARPAQAITLADVAARISADSAVTEIFREADRVEYGRAESMDLSPWRSRLHSAMNSLAS